MTSSLIHETESSTDPGVKPSAPVAKPDPRAELAAGLRGLADFFEQNPDVPLTYSAGRVAHCVLASDDAAGNAEVARLAAVMGVDVENDGTGGSCAVRQFAGLRFEVYYVSRQRSAEHQALTSYNGSVRPVSAVETAAAAVTA